MNPETRSLIRSRGVGVHETSVRIDDTRELFLSWYALPGEAPAAVFARCYRYWEAHPSVHILRLNVLARFSLQPGQGQLYRLNDREWPGSWSQHSGAETGHVFGIQAQALSGVKVRHLSLRDRIVGVAYEDQWARHCVLSGLRPDNARLSPARQADAVFDLAEEALALAGLEFTDVYRTWFFLDDIRSWYDEFTEVRNAFFRSRGIFARPVPISTEVGARNGIGTAVVADFLAMRPKCSEARYFEVTLEHPAPDKPFGRAIAFNLPGLRRLYVSGTGNLRPAGRPVEPDIARAQVGQTLDAVETLLRSRGMSWRDIVRGMAYFRRTEDTIALELWREAHQLDHWPVLATQAGLGRDDLFFVLEVDAVQPG